MKKLGKILAWILGLLVMSMVIAYNVFVQDRFDKLPSDRAPTAIDYPDRIQRTFWDAEFGGDDMKIRPMPLWKWLWNIREIMHTQSFGSPSFKAASSAGKALLFRQGYSKNQIEFQLDWLFASIWISKHWTAQDVVNTLLAESYFGLENHGLQSAATTYFGVDPEELTNEEMVFLSGMTRRPAATNPWTRPDDAKKMAGGLLRKVAKAGNVPVESDPELCFKRLQKKPDRKPSPQQ